MPLIMWREARRMASSTGSRAPPVHLVQLLLPRHVHIIHFLQLQVNWVPAVCVSLRAPIVIMAWDPDIQKALRLCRAKDGIQRRDGAPVREEVALVIVLVRARAKVEGGGGRGGHKGEIRTGLREGGGKVVVDFVREGVA